MEDLMNNEELAPKPKKAKVAEVVVNPDVEKVRMFYGRCQGNANRIAAQTGLSKAVVEQIIADGNL